MGKVEGLPGEFERLRDRERRHRALAAAHVLTLDGVLDLLNTYSGPHDPVHLREAAVAAGVQGLSEEDFELLVTALPDEGTRLGRWTESTVTIDVERAVKVLGCQGPAVADLAMVWPVRLDRLAYALHETGVDVDERQALEVHARITEHVVEHELALSRRASTLASPGIVDSVPPVGALHVAPSLRALLPAWALALAADIARRYVAAVVIAECSASEMMGCAGMAILQSDRRVVIGLSDDFVFDTTRVAVLAHELGHVLDPALPKVGKPGREAFADALAELLVAHEPQTVDRALPLIADALESTIDVRRGSPPILTAGDILLWALADAGVVSSWVRDVNPPLSSHPSGGRPRPAGAEGGAPSLLGVPSGLGHVPGPDSPIHHECEVDK